MKKIALMLLGIAMFGVLVVEAQVKSISGTATSSDDGTGIPGVSVSVKGTTIGTVTNMDGEYQLDVPTDAETLVFSFVGMKSQEVAISGTTVNVKMQADLVGLDEVMVVAYGTAKKESFTGSAEVINNDALEKRPVSNVSKALEGQVSGLQTTSGGGQPGSSASIVIRGFGSINSSNTPLYVVDGIPYDGAMNAISPSDIESITVLKDASAGALYGSRGANGVVLITTKKGDDSGKIEVSLKASYGLSNKALEPYDVLNSSEFMETSFQGYKNYEIYENGIDPDMAGGFALAALANSGTGLFGSDEEYNPYDMPINQLIDPVTGKVNSAANLLYEDNWLDEITNKNAIRQEYEINLTGGTDKTKVFSSFGYLDEDGVLKETSFDRFSGRVGVEVEPKDWVKMGGNVSFAQTNTDILGFDGSSTSNVWYSAQFMSSIYPVYQRDENGDHVLNELGEKQFDYGSSRPAGAQPNFNSVATLYDDKNYYQRDNVSGRFHFDILGDGIQKVVKGLKLTTNLGFDKYTTRQTVYYNPLHGNAKPPVNGRLTKNSTTARSYTWNQLLTYEKEIGNHSFSLLAGHENYAYKSDILETSKTGFPFSEIYELAPGATIASSTSYQNNYTINSYLSNFTYDYSERYYLSASYRTDGSSRFYEDAQWGDFWSVGASWRITEESFVNVDQIDNLKLKASYGVQGNDAIGTFYGWQALYDLGWPNGASNGALVSSVENKNLKWEENANFNVGLEGRVFDRVGFSFEYFNRTTNDMLMQLPMATSLGFDSYWSNVGEMKNTGFDLSINGDIIKSNDIKWNVGILTSVLKNEIVKLDGEKPEIVTSSIRINREGEELNSFYLTRSAGVDIATGDQLYWVWDENEDGTISDKYVSNDKNKAANCREVVGSRIPDFYGSINSDFSAYGFDFSFLTTFSVGGYVYDGLYRSLMEPLYRGQNYHSNILRAWQNPGDVTDVPKVQSELTTTVTDRFLVDASYFAIKNITVGYTLPKSFLSKIDLSSVRLYCTLDNVALFSHLDGMDPQYNFSGSTDYTYTPIKSTVFGIEVKF